MESTTAVTSMHEPCQDKKIGLSLIFQWVRHSCSRIAMHQTRSILRCVRSHLDHQKTLWRGVLPIPAVITANGPIEIEYLLHVNFDIAAGDE